MVPPIPSWNAVHPLIVHFPIALLFVAPVFVVLAMVVRSQRQGFSLAALILMGIGVAAAFLAVATGEAAASLVPQVGEVRQVLHDHERLTELSRTLFVLLTAAYAMIVSAPRIFPKRMGKPAWHNTLQVIFLCGYVVALLVLTNAAHRGARLVHEYGQLAHLTETTARMP